MTRPASVALIGLTALAIATPPAIAYSEPYAAPPLRELALVQTELSATPARDQRNPELAAALPILAPLAIGFIPGASAGGGMFLPVLLPLGIGLGHVYAGDPLRGGLFALGAVPALGASFVAMLHGAFGQNPFLLALGAAGFVAYPLWVSVDAYQTTLRENDRRARQANEGISGWESR